MRYALIGCGRISPNHLEAAKNNELDIVAICDIVPEKMKDIYLRLNLSESVAQYTDYKEMLTKEKPELVAIATESGKHAAIALDCIDAGCNLIIEKPISLSIADANSIIAASKKKNVLVCTSHQNRFNKSIQYIRKAIEDGRFGRMLYSTAHIRWNRDKDYYTQAPWRGTWEQDGGALMNQCIHNIDLLCWMMKSDVDEVFAYTDNLEHPYIQAEDLGMALIKFKNGSYGIVEGTTNIFPQNLEETLYLFGENGTVKAGGKSVNIIEEWAFRDNLDDPEFVKNNYNENPPSVYGFGHTPLYADVIDAVTNGRQPYISATEGKRALELILAIYKSAAEGRPIKLPLTECSTIDFIGRFANEC